MNELVSVIVPVFNTEKYVGKCIESILTQTYSNIELILIDDGSKDSSLNIMKSFNDSRIVLISKENEGVSAARNLGLKIAKGTYISLVDSDDYIEPNMIEVLVDAIEKTGADISSCKNDYRRCSQSHAKISWDKDRVIKEFLIHKKMNGQLTAKLFKKCIADGCRFDSKIHYGEDALFLWDLLMNTNYFCSTDSILYHVTIHDDSASGGGFKPIRMESHIVWSRISEEAKMISKDCYSLAKAQLGNMAFFSWYSLIISHYDRKDYEIECVRIVRENLKYMLQVDFLQGKTKVSACVLSICPNLFKNILKKRQRRLYGEQA